MSIDLSALTRTIQVLCTEVKDSESQPVDWETLHEEDLFYEAAVCISGSQMVYELAVAVADRLRNRGLLCAEYVRRNISTYEASVRHALSENVEFSDGSGIRRCVYPRFKNRLSSLLVATGTTLYVDGPTIREILTSVRDGRSARAVLVRSVAGFGPKQASLFLRRIGYCPELAVLDGHVLDYLHLARGIRPSQASLSRVASYERVEEEFCHVATDFGHSVGCVDLAVWVTMRVAKREYGL